MKRSTSLIQGLIRTGRLIFHLLFFSTCFYLCGIACAEESSTTNTYLSTEEETEAQEVDPIELAVESVVKIYGDKFDSQKTLNKSEKYGNAFNGVGTGIIIDSRGYIVTNFHVIDGIRGIKVTTQDGKTYTGINVASDPVADIAIIKINTNNRKFVPIRIGKSSTVRRSQFPVFAIGNPLDDYSFSVTHGAISFLGRDIYVNPQLTYENAIQTSININPGNSGGPLLNEAGEMIGMIAAIRPDAAGISFAIPVDQVVDVSTKMILKQVAQSVYHGIHVKPAKTPKNRLVVSSVDPNSPAEKCGIAPGDVLLFGNEMEIKNTLDFALSMLDFRGNESFAVKLERKQEQYEFDLVFAAQNKQRNGRSIGSGDYAFTSKSGINQVKQPTAAVSQPNSRYGSKVTAEAPSTPQEIAWTVFGIRYSTYTPEQYSKLFSQYEGFYPEGGVRVEKVRANSPLYFAGIKEGDTIFLFDEWIIANDDDVIAIASALQSMKQETRKPVKVKIMLNRPKVLQGKITDDHRETEMEF